MHHLVPTIRLKTEKLIAFSFLSIPSSHLSPEFGAYHSLVCLLYFYYIHIYKQGITLFYTFSFGPPGIYFLSFAFFQMKFYPCYSLIETLHTVCITLHHFGVFALHYYIFKMSPC